MVEESLLAVEGSVDVMLRDTLDKDTTRDECVNAEERRVEDTRSSGAKTLMVVRLLFAVRYGGGLSTYMRTDDVDLMLQLLTPLGQNNGSYTVPVSVC